MNNWLDKYKKAPDGVQLKFLQPNSYKLPSAVAIPNRPDIQSSELAISIGGENGEPAYLIPSFKGGKRVNALKEFNKTGEHLGGPFKTWQEADKWENEVRHPYVEKGQSIPSPLKTWGEMEEGGKISKGKPTLKEISQIPQKLYEPSEAVKNTKAGLGALSMIPIPLNPFGVAGSVYDMGTTVKYAADGQWDKAGEDFVQSGLDLIPSTAGLLSGIKGAKLINKVNKGRAFVSLAKGVSNGKSIMEAPVITREPIDWAGGVNRELNPNFDARGYENQMKSPYEPPITGEGAPYIKKENGGWLNKYK